MGTGRGRRGPITHSHDEEAGSQRGSQLRNYMKQVTLPLKKKKKVCYETSARRSNQFILKDISPEYSLEGLMLKLKLQYFGHLM